jgi:hypothetical protein
MVRPRALQPAAVPNTGWCLTCQPVFMQEREGVAGLSLQVITWQMYISMGIDR